MNYLLISINSVALSCSGLGPGGLPPFTPTPYETIDSTSTEAPYGSTVFSQEQKLGDFKITSSTFPRNSFCGRDESYNNSSYINCKSDNFQGKVIEEIMGKQFIVVSHVTRHSIDIE